MFNHGFCDSAENFDDVFPEYAARGYEVICFDQRGAGKTSPGKLFAITNERLVYLDLDNVIETIIKDYEGKLFLAGHSMVCLKKNIIMRGYCFHVKEFDMPASSQ